MKTRFINYGLGLLAIIFVIAIVIIAILTYNLVY